MRDPARSGRQGWIRRSHSALIEKNTRRYGDTEKAFLNASAAKAAFVFRKEFSVPPCLRVAFDQGKPTNASRYQVTPAMPADIGIDRKSTRLNSSHSQISY